MIRGLGGADRMLIAQMDAMVTPLGPMTGDTSALERELDAIAADRRARRLPARAALRDRRACAASTAAEIVVVSDGALGAARATRRAPVHLGDAKLSYVPRRQAGEERRHHAVLGAPLPARQEPLRGDARAHQHAARTSRTSSCSSSATARSSTSRSCASSPASACRASTRSSPARAARSRRRSRASTARTTICPPTTTRTRSCPSGAARKVLVVTAGQHVPRGGAAARRVPRRHRRRPAGLRDGHREGRAGTRSSSTASPPPSSRRPTRSTSIRAAPASPVKRRGRRSRQPGFDKIDRKHPVVRFLALDDVNVAERAQARAREPATRSSARPTAGPRRSSWRARAAATSSSRSASTCARAICRCASRGRSSSSTASTGSPTRTRSTSRLPHRRRLAHPGRRRGGEGDRQDARRQRRSRSPCTRARGVPRRARRLLRARRTTPATTPRGPSPFAANLLDAEESAIAPQDKLDRRRQGRRRARRAFTSACAARSGSTCCSPPRS